MRNFLCEPLTYVRNVDRIGIIEALANSGAPLTICGAGWDAFLGSRSNVNYVDRVAFDDLPRFYANARIVLNLNAGNGACERAIYAALAGAAVASDYSPMLASLFGDDGISVFNRAKPETAAHVVERLLDPRRGEATAEAGRAAVARSGTWRRRAQQIVDFVAAD